MGEYGLKQLPLIGTTVDGAGGQCGDCSKETRRFYAELGGVFIPSIAGGLTVRRWSISERYV